MLAEARLKAMEKKKKQGADVKGAAAAQPQARAAAAMADPQNEPARQQNPQALARQKAREQAMMSNK